MAEIPAMSDKEMAEIEKEYNNLIPDDTILKIDEETAKIYDDFTDRQKAIVAGAAPAYGKELELSRLFKMLAFKEFFERDKTTVKTKLLKISAENSQGWSAVITDAETGQIIPVYSGFTVDFPAHDEPGPITANVRLVIDVAELEQVYNGGEISLNEWGEPVGRFRPREEEGDFVIDEPGVKTQWG